MNEQSHLSSSRLTEQVGFSTELQQQLRLNDDQVWIEVIQRMDSIYADLVHYQVELEEKNTALEDAQSFIQSVITSMSEILIVCDINGHIQQVNQALIESIGKTAEQLKGKDLSVLFCDRYLPQIAEFPEHIRSGTLIDCEVELINDQQQPVPMAINCSARLDHDYRLSGLVITGRPLGELRKAYAELQRTHEELKTAQLQLIQSEKMASLGRLVAGVAHELNNPISFLYANMHALRGYQQKFKLYMDALHGGSSAAECKKLREQLRIDAMMDDIEPLVEGSMEGAERVSEIVKNLRKFSTPQQSEKQPMDLIAVINRASSWILKSASARLEVINDCPAQLIIINNEGHVHQILINLLQNAIDAMQQTEHPRLQIRVEQDNTFAHIHIRDNGHGIKTQDLVKLFDPFFTTKPVGSGTGLGLYISFGLATEQCHGNLRAQNNSDGGSEFIFSLPLELKP
ncbi:MAG: PAS domain-containing protein [Gammaproteobacteria bacterium]|nr:PAS domain-containing protein [Gammaproteobacteria bacterium]MBL6998853.1 PAS domain-containing protein [Gammaproteobacteria bacterium]